MTEDYTIEQLEKTFKEHTDKYAIENKERSYNFKNNFPDSELPEYLKDDAFNISKALHVICREINQLKTQIGFINNPFNLECAILGDQVKKIMEID